MVLRVSKKPNDVHVRAVERLSDVETLALACHHLHTSFDSTRPRMVTSATHSFDVATSNVIFLFLHALCWKASKTAEASATKNV